MSDTTHLVQFFSNDARRIAAVSDYLRDGFLAGETCIVVVGPEHREAIDAQLIQRGLNPAALSAEYQYIPLDAQPMLEALFDPATGFDRERFHNDCGLLIRQAAARGQPVRIFGEMVGLLVEQGRHAAALELEELWNELSRHYSFKLFCTYDAAAFSDNPRYRKLLHGVHSHVLPEEA